MLSVTPCPLDPKTKLRILVLMGGPSSEREISLVSGRAVMNGLKDFPVEIEYSDPREGAEKLLRTIKEFKPDVAFNALHGALGEDGAIQGFLEIAGVPYTHSDVLASALAMDKVRTRDMLTRYDLPVALGKVVTPRELANSDPLDTRYVIKPVAEGSSVGVYVLDPAQDAKRREIAEQLKNHKTLLIEKFVDGLELTVGVIEGKALEITEIRPAQEHGFYDFDAKYAQNGSVHILPAPVPREIADKLRDYAERAHNILGCQGPSRCDFRYDPKTEELIIMEINSQPGMTATSLLPEQAQKRGVSFSDLCLWIALDPLRRAGKLPSEWENTGILR